MLTMGWAPGSRRVQSRRLLGAFFLVLSEFSDGSMGLADGSMGLADGWARGNRPVQSRWLSGAFFTCSFFR